MIATVTITNDEQAWRVQITAASDEHDRILVDLRQTVGAYRRIHDGAYRVAGHRELMLRQFMEQVREHGGIVAWEGGCVR